MQFVASLFHVKLVPSLDFSWQHEYKSAAYGYCVIIRSWLYLSTTGFPCHTYFRAWYLQAEWQHKNRNHHHHHHHHVPEGLGVLPVPWTSNWSWPLHLFFGRPMFLRPFGLYRNTCFVILFVSIHCTCCSHFFWYCFISSTMFCAPKNRNKEGNRERQHSRGKRPTHSRIYCWLGIHDDWLSSLCLLLFK